MGLVARRGAPHAKKSKDSFEFWRGQGDVLSSRPPSGCGERCFTA